MDVVENTLQPEPTDLGGDTMENSSDSDNYFQEDEDIGEIAFDIATEAVDEITKVRKRLGKRIDEFKDERDKILKKV